MTVLVSDWSETPASNTTIDGTNIAEGCPPGNINGAIRSLMAGVKTLSGTIPSTSSYMLKAAGTFSGTQPIYTGEGAFTHHQNAAYTSGKIWVQASGGSAPSGMASGDILLEY